MKSIYYFPLCLVLAFSFTSCLTDDVEVTEGYYYPEELALLQENLNLPDGPLDYSVVLPAHITRAGLFTRSINKDMATLGRVLFYDKALSKDGQISCASCHKQELGFSDNKALSDGINDNVTGRNSLALGSVVSFAAYYGTDLFGTAGVPFLWDNRAGTARDQARLALTSSKEMGLTMDEVAEIVQGQDFYGPLFRRAYGDKEVTPDRVLAAIAEFVDGLSSFNSKFDIAAETSTSSVNSSISQNFDGFTDAENMGKLLFLNNCASCHSTNIGGRPGKTAANNGLDVTYTDLGIGGVTNYASDNYKFKVPTLRNVAVTAPYMHDGRFETLEEVIDFYSENIASHPSLDTDLQDSDGQAIQFNYTAAQKIALIDFLNTLTDESYLDPVLSEKYSDPFKR